jgi:hypothetical protein
MKINEPLAYKMLEPLGQGEGLMDFKILKHYAHHTERVYSTEIGGEPPANPALF